MIYIQTQPIISFWDLSLSDSEFQDNRIHIENPIHFTQY